jgi:hypoxanthine phosphoribosyltransferase
MNLIDDLANKIKEKGKVYDDIYAVPRGGLIPAACLAHRLSITSVSTNIDDINMNTLIVDDIADSGDTLNSLLDDLPIRANIACVVKKTCAEIEPDFVAFECDSSVWIVFPWELPDSKEEKDQ